jgi:branched-chain amino acid transport system permease protein
MTRKRFWSNPSFLTSLAVGIILITLPLFGLEGYRLRLLSLVFMWAALAGCWNIMSGYTGYIDFGPVAYFGVGSYCTALLMIKGGVPFILSVFFSGWVCAGLSLVIGLTTLRLHGAYFAIATFAAAEAIKQVILEWDQLAGFKFFGGAHGLTLPLAPSETFFYYVLLFFMGLTAVLAALLENSKFGYGLRAIREGEQAAEMSGVPTLSIKVRAYVLSSSLIGCIGGVEAYWLTYIIPDDVFSVMHTIQMVVMTLLGGMGTVLGPVIGASFLTLISEYLGARFVYDYLIFVGLVVIIVILIFPQGIIGAIRGKKGWNPCRSWSTRK